MSDQTTVLDPTGFAPARAFRLARKLHSLNGAKIGLLDNRKPNAEALLDQVSMRLAERHGASVVSRQAKHTPTGPASAEVLDDLEKAELVLIAMSDCGGCAAWSVRDAVEIERRGIPTLLFATDDFAALVEAQMKLRGSKNLATVTLAHPYGQIPEAEARRRADAVMDQVVANAASSVRDAGAKIVRSQPSDEALRIAV